MASSPQGVWVVSSRLFRLGMLSASLIAIGCWGPGPPPVTTAKEQLEAAGWKVSMTSAEKQWDLIHNKCDDEAVKTLVEVLTADDAPKIEELVIEFEAAEVTDAGFRQLTNLSNVRRLKATGAAKLRPAAFEGCENWKILESLTVSDSSLDEGVFNQLVKLPGLERLNLSGNKSITGQNLNRLSEIKTLENLNLKGTGLTDEGLKTLKGHKSLRFLNVENTGLTAEGVEFANGWLDSEEFPALDEVMPIS